MKCTIDTFSGHRVNPLAILPSDVRIEDVAHALALCNRFAGHTREPISVAQHSVYVSRIVERVQSHEQSLRDRLRAQLQGLLHDGSEAFLGDVTKWLKGTPTMKGYREAEAAAERAVYDAFDCCWTTHPEVEMADRLMVKFEGWKGFGDHFKIEHPDYPPLTAADIELVGEWNFWPWQQAEDAFLTRYRYLKLGLELAGDR